MPVIINNNFRHPEFPNSPNIPRRSVYNGLPGWPRGPGAMEADTILSMLDEGADGPPIDEVTIPAQGDPV
jgi:hypothetical protein